MERKKSSSGSKTLKETKETPKETTPAKEKTPSKEVAKESVDKETPKKAGRPKKSTTEGSSPKKAASKKEGKKKDDKKKETPKSDRPKREIIKRRLSFPASTPTSSTTSSASGKKTRKPVTTKQAKEKASSKKSSTKSSTSKASASKKGKSSKHPSYKKLIKEAIISLGKRGGSSSRAISNWIKENYTVPTTGTFNRFLRETLAKGVENGELSVNKMTYKLIGGKKEKASPSTSKRSRSTTKKEDSTPKKRSRSSTKEKETSTKKKRTASASPAKSSRKKKDESTKKSTTAKPPRAKKSKVSSSIDENENSSETSESAEVTSLPRPTGLKGDYIWQYFDGNWRNYNPAASDTVEDVYLKYLENKGDTDVRAVKSGQWEYQVDFAAMKQTNINHENHTIRNIRRIKVQ